MTLVRGQACAIHYSEKRVGIIINTESIKFVDPQQHHNGPNFFRLSSSPRRVPGNPARPCIPLGVLNAWLGHFLLCAYFAFATPHSCGCHQCHCFSIMTMAWSNFLVLSSPTPSPRPQTRRLWHSQGASTRRGAVCRVSTTIRQAIGRLYKIYDFV